jgi:Acyl-coenzyme A:6-aminopenicillanic acid acyl-transferase
MAKWCATPAIALAATIILVAGSISSCAAAKTAEAPSLAAQQAFPPAFIVAGTPRERGVAYGKHYRDEIRAFLDREIYQTFIGNPSSKEEMLRYAADCGKVAQEVCPMVVEECRGIAEGAGLSYDEVVLINLHEELYHRGKLPYDGHCTAVAVPPSDTGDGHTYVGQTWDWMTRVAGKSTVTDWQSNDAPSVLAYGYPGIPMGAGMNSRGIALCWTTAWLGKKGMSPRVGVPTYMLIAHLLAQKDLDSVIREARRDKHAGWFTFVMADGEGNLVNVEGSPQGIAIEQPKDRLARAYYGTREMTAAKPGEDAKLHPRCQQMYKLLEQSAGKNDRQMLEHYFTDRDDQIMSWKSPSNKTIDVMIFDTTARKAYLSRGPEYHLEWREFEFPTSTLSAANQ